MSTASVSALLATNVLRRNVIPSPLRRLAAVARTAGSRPVSTGRAVPLPFVAVHHFSSMSSSIFSQQQQRQQNQKRTMVVITKTSPADVSDTADASSSMQASGNSATENSVKAATASSTELEVTPSCIKQIHTLLKKRNKTPEEMFLRVFVDAGGCSGFTYQFELDDEFIPEEDKVFEPPGSNGARVVVDEASLNLIHGSKIDYVQEMIKSAFVVAENPQSESACGCGSSFAIKNFSSNPALD